MDVRLRDAVGPQIAYVDAIRAALPDDGIFVDELTQVGYVQPDDLPDLRATHAVVDRVPGHIGLGFRRRVGGQR